MPHRTGSSNVYKRVLIAKLARSKNDFWKAVSGYLNVPSRQAKSVNLYQICKNAVKGDIIVVPGKILGNGDLKEKVTIACFQVSASAKQKILEQGSTLLTIQEAFDTYPQGKTPKGQAARIFI